MWCWFGFVDFGWMFWFLGVFGCLCFWGICSFVYVRGCIVGVRCLLVLLVSLFSFDGVLFVDIYVLVFRDVFRYLGRVKG